MTHVTLCTRIIAGKDRATGEPGGFDFVYKMTDSQFPRVSCEFVPFTEDVPSPFRSVLGSWKGHLLSLLATVCALLCVLAFVIYHAVGT